MRGPAAIAALLAMAGPAAAQPVVMLAPPPPAAVTDGLAAFAQDAGVYAAHYGVTLDEAIARLRAQEASVAETDAIALAYRDRLAGIVVEHVPTFRIVVHLTGDAPVADRSIETGGLVVPVVFRTDAVATRDAVLAAIARDQGAIRFALIDPPGLGVDPTDGRLALAVGRDDADLDGLDAIATRIEAIAGVPVHAVLVGRDANLAIAGGARLQAIDWTQRRVQRCTAGFLVTDGARIGLTTAAHCPDTLDIVADDGIRTTLPLIGAWGAGRQDVQIHAVPGSPPPRIQTGRDPVTMRSAPAARPPHSLRAGDVVCHQGVVSGYSCAAVRYPDYAPPGDLCAGPCPASWAMVDGPDCAHGDSGGPVFVGTVAVGLVKGGSFRPDGGCSAYYLMPIDALPDGWTLLTAPPDPTAR